MNNRTISSYWLQWCLHVCVLLTFLLSPLQSIAAYSPPPAPPEPAQPDMPATGLYRTTVVVRTPADWRRLEQLGVVVLGEITADQQENADSTAAQSAASRKSAVILATADQLQTLARLRFQPRRSDELGSLLRAQGPAKAWLRAGLQPLLDQGVALHQIATVDDADADAVAALRKELRAALGALTAEQKAGIASSISPDFDGDGLTDTEELWWCTDPENDNTDGDAFGYTDGQEVDALLDFTLPRTVRWNYGPPFGPPNAWPDFNGADGDPNTPRCNDGDFDTIPDQAEAYMVGTRVGTGDSENTDGDKFDDGQELFGTTYCPGAPLSCGYGSYPRTQDFSFITSGMPSWIRPPGDSPFVAAYPVIEFLVDPDTIRIVTKEIRTIERTITEGEEISTGFAETEGNSTTVGTVDTNTHSTWQEHSTTEGGIEPETQTSVNFLDSESRFIEAPALPRGFRSDKRETLAKPRTESRFVCWGDKGDLILSEKLSDTERAICHAVFARAFEGDQLAIAEGSLKPSPELELLVNSIKPLPPSTDGSQRAWVQAFIRNKVWRDKGVYSEWYAIAELSGATWLVMLAGSEGFNLRLDAVPETIASQEAKEALRMWADPLPQPPGTRFYLPWTKGEKLNVYTQPPHGGTWAWDFQTDPRGTILRATRPGYAYAYDGHTGYGCTDYYYRRANWVLINHGDGTASLYLHLKPGGALAGKGDRWGEWVEQGTPIGISGNIGYSLPCPGGVHHLHFQVQKWSGAPTWNSAEQYYNNVFNYTSYRIRFEEYPGTDTLPSPATSGNPHAEPAQNACYAPGVTSGGSQQPTTLNRQQKATSFWESIGRLFKGWWGKLTRGGGTTNLVLLSTSQPGCDGSSCAGQVGRMSNTPLNFSDHRSDGQCGGNSYPGGGSDFGVGGGGSGTAINDNGDGTWDRLRVWSETTTTGEGHSTSHSELRSETEYSEITRSQVNTLVSSEAWSTATTTDPTDAAQLTFNYNLRNVGSDAAVKLTGVRINILIGDLPVITWNAPDSSNILPGQAKGPFSSDPITLSLDQLAAIDNGAPIRIVLADYGYDDQLYDQNAWGRSVLFHVDDGTADGDETIDTYLITTQLVQNETYQDTLARYFPVDVFDGAPDDPRTGTITNIRTPEFDSNGEISGWSDHPVGENGWWELSISAGGETPGVRHFKDMPAKPRTDVYLRYFADSDGDGYSDRAELDALSDPNNPEIHPRPLMVAAQHTVVDGDTATVQLSLQNSGNFDASSVEVWAVAPDDTITITDNLIGGGGRVRAGTRVVLGARIGKPDLSNWTTGTAKPYPSGQFEGLSPRTYSFRADNSGTVGSTTDLTISWSDDGTTWTPLDVGGSYTPLDLLPLADGLSIAFTAGYISTGETFTFQTALPIDTFSYTINQTPHTPPLIVVSYNDPQGNHKFVSDVELAQIQDDLTPYLGSMRYGFQLDVMGAAPFAEGANTAYLVFNNPSATTISGGNLFVEFATPDGTVAQEYALQNQTFQPGPNVATLHWNTADFNSAFDPEADYHILVFAADRQGTIFESTVKDLDQVGHDRLPLAILPSDTWDFGTAQQGTLLRRTIAVGNIGFNDLLSYVETTPGLSVSAQGSRRLPPADVALYDLTLNTAELPEGPFERTLSIRTSDPERPTRTITIRGTITPMPPDSPGGATLRPLDWDAVIPGDHSQGEWVEFTHTLGPDPQSLHPVKVYSQDYSTLYGVGKYATPFGQGTASADMFGTGQDGDKTVTGNEDLNPVRARASGTAGSTTLNISGVTGGGFQAGQLVMIHQTRGTDAGKWEFNHVESVSGGQLTLRTPLQNTYVTDAGASRAQVLWVPQYRNVTIEAGATVSPAGWDGNVGGILAFLANGTVTVAGTISANGADSTNYNSTNVDGGGYRGGAGGNTTYDTSYQGEGTSGAGSPSTSANGSGGGGATAPDSSSGVGGVAGSADLTTMVFGGASGGSSSDTQIGYHTGDGMSGANGGGIVVLIGTTVTVTGAITSNGGDGRTESDVAGSGGGAGGSILIKVQTAMLDSGLITANGGSGGANSRWQASSGGGHATVGGDASHGGHGGAGGDGRIRVEYCEMLDGSTNPPASTQKLNCYVVEQVESAPYDRARLNLPESFTGGRTYKVQYGRRYVFSSADQQTQFIRLPKQIYASAGLDALVSNTGVSSGGLNLSLDIGNDGTADWSHNATTTFPATLAVSDIVDALNAYLVSRTDVAWGADVNVPVRVQIDRQAEVILTNLVLSLQFNQPSTLSLASIETGADRPLDWTTVIAGDHSQGEAYDFTHTLGPEPASIRPCKVYDQSGSMLKGVGKYCSDFGSDTLPYQVFGTGRDGDLTVGSGQTRYTDNVRTALSGSANSGQRTVSVAGTSGFTVGDEVLIIQMQGTGAGNYEFGTIESVGSGSLTLAQNLANTYTVGGSSRAQALRVPHYRDVAVQSGGTLTVRAWNGSTGGVAAMRIQGAFEIQAGGTVSAKGKGYRGGSPTRIGAGDTQRQGEGLNGEGIYSSSSNYGGGGGGQNETGDNQANHRAGGGGGYGTAGRPGNGPGSGGTGGGGSGGGTYGDPKLTTLFLGGGSGGGGGDWRNRNPAVPGVSGGGILIVYGGRVSVNGILSAEGEQGNDTSTCKAGSGGGAGGSIKLITAQALLDDGTVLATGGSGGLGGCSWEGPHGGAGGDGRIYIEYQTISGSTDPTPTLQPRAFYIIKQIEESPYITARFYLPESFTGGRTYIVQFGRRFTFAGAGEQTNYLRLNRQMYGTADLDALISNTGVSSGNLNLCLDVGDDGICDFTHNAGTDFPATLNVTGLATALNSYLLSRTDVPWGDPVDAPVRVQIDRQADVMLTNLALTPVGAKTRFLRLPARSYSDVALSLQFSQPGVPSGPLSFTVDVGADGSIDWPYAGTTSFPATLTSPNLADAFNTYLSGRTGEVDVPIRIVPSPFLDTNLYDFTATPADLPDMTLSAAGISFESGSGLAANKRMTDHGDSPSVYPLASAAPTEGDVITVTATISNTGQADAGPLTVAFYAVRNTQSHYIGAAFVPDVPAGGTAQASIRWNTLGFTGDVPVRVVIDPFDRLAEADETNNEATTNITILTRPDLQISNLQFSNLEPVAGQPVTVTLTISNAGQTAAAASALALYDGNPESDGTLVCERMPAVSGKSEMVLECTWTPAAPGPHRLLVVSDRDDTIDESDEGNNRTWRDVYVGFKGPILLDSGGSNDSAYTPEQGYGFVDEDQDDGLGNCGSEPHQTYRRDPSGQVVYRFDHLLPGHFYHLDLTLYECDGAGREEIIYVDGNPVSGTVSLGDGEIHRLSIRLDPALYADHTVIVSIEAPGIDGAVVSQINLHDIDYRYADAGGANDPEYLVGRDGISPYGWLDGVAPDPQPWGTLPYQSVRVDQDDNELRYRFDGLNPTRNYNLHLTFWEGGGATRILKVQIDGADTGVTVTVVAGADTQNITVPVPLAAYQDDGSIVVSIVRTDGATVGAMVNEIALEEETFTSSMVLHGQVALERRGNQGDDRWITQLYRGSKEGIRVYEAGTTNLQGVFSATTDADGRFSVELMGIDPGPYDICLEGANTLSSKKPDISLPSDTEIYLGILRVGDSNGDDCVNGADVSYMVPSFLKCEGDPAFRPYADTNKDGCINGADVSALVPNFLTCGDCKGAAQAVTQREQLTGDASTPTPRRAQDTAGLGATLSLSPSSPSVQAGDIFTLSIVANTGGGEADTVDAYIDFNPTYLEVVDESGAPATTIEPNSAIFDFVSFNAVNNEAGQINLSVSKLGDPLTGTFTVATIRLRARAKADATEVILVRNGARRSDLYQSGEPLNATLTNTVPKHE